MEGTEKDVKYELRRKKTVCKFCNREFKGIHGYRRHLTNELKNATSNVERGRIHEEIARVKRRYREVLNINNSHMIR